IAWSMYGTFLKIGEWIDEAAIIPAALGQTIPQQLSTQDLADPSPAARTKAYTELLAKGSSALPLLVQDIPKLKAQWMTDQKNPATYYQLLGSLNLAVELTNRDQESTNLFRSAIAKSMSTENPSAPVRALAELANVDDRSIRVSATRILTNAIDNN